MAVETNTSWPRRPDWFAGAWTDALQIAQRDHGPLEGLLGVARLITGGNMEEAHRIYRTGIQPHLLAQKLQPYPGETESTQLVSMIQSGMYPRDLCEEIAQTLNIRV